MSEITFSGLRFANVTRCKRWHPPGSTPWSAADWSNALCGEAGEFANKVKKIRRHETGTVNEGDPSREELVKMAAKELADVVIYADLNAHHLGIDLAEVIREKFNETSERFKFPERL